MIDLHAHILPGIDDGPRTLEDAIEMARVARADGIAAIAATSHAGDRSFGWTREQYEAALASVRAVLSEAEIDLEIIPGCEALIDVEFVASPESRLEQRRRPLAQTPSVRAGSARSR